MKEAKSAALGWKIRGLKLEPCSQIADAVKQGVGQGNDWLFAINPIAVARNALPRGRRRPQHMYIYIYIHNCIYIYICIICNWPLTVNWPIMLNQNSTYDSPY